MVGERRTKRGCAGRSRRVGALHQAPDRAASAPVRRRQTRAQFFDTLLDQAEILDGVALLAELGDGRVDPGAREVVEVQTLDDLE